MWRKKIGVLIQTIAILALAACSVGADLEFIQTQSDRISITGEICSQDPFSITSPVNISIVIDVSGSMATTDPSLFRVSAAQQVVNKYLPKENYKFQIIKFSNAAENLTSGFTRDPTIINSAIGALSQADGGTNYQDAFNSTRSGIEQEIIDLEDNQGSAATAYFPILFLSDGVPTLPSGNPQGNAISALNLLMGIKNIYTIGDLRLHAAFLGAANSAGYIFMQQVAAIGLGIFLHFQNASDISFLDQGIGSFLSPNSVIGFEPGLRMLTLSQDLVFASLDSAMVVRFIDDRVDPASIFGRSDLVMDFIVGPVCDFTENTARGGFDAGLRLSSKLDTVPIIVAMMPRWFGIWGIRDRWNTKFSIIIDPNPDRSRSATDTKALFGVEYQVDASGVSEYFHSINGTVVLGW